MTARGNMDLVTRFWPVQSHGREKILQPVTCMFVLDDNFLKVLIQNRTGSYLLIAGSGFRFEVRGVS